LLFGALLVAGCGGSKSSTPSTKVPPRSSPTTTTTSSGVPALQAEAQSAATGDIPDNQVFLRYRSAAGWSIKYPEGWARTSVAGGAVFHDKNNIVRIVVQSGARPTAKSVTASLSALAGAQAQGAPQPIRLPSGPAVKAQYRTQSPPSSVTGKRVTLAVDRYEVGSGGRLAVIDLGTPVGVDNVDAYRLISQSFRWG